MEKYKNKFRIPSARWTTWDYAANAAYFITICTAQREQWFGAVANDDMTLNPLGRAAAECWHEIPAHFPFVRLDEFVVMPNHVHGIIEIDKSLGSVRAPDAVSSPSPTQDRFGPQSQNLASIVRGYKIGVTKFARTNDLPFRWQDRYHDHVIRTDKELERIRNYIRENPKTWQNDTHYTLP